MREELLSWLKTVAVLPMCAVKSPANVRCEELEVKTVSLDHASFLNVHVVLGSQFSLGMVSCFNLLRMNVES